MARFVYRLAGVLNIKLQLETQAKMEFGQASAALKAEEDKLDGFKKRRRAYLEAGRALRKSGLNVLELKENEKAIKTMDEIIAGQAEKVRIAERALERARAKLTEAMKERKIQERLREKAFEEFLEEEKHTEAKETDELVSYKYGAGR